ncbi:hypothetical protein [Geodermatophilus sp. URMC 64]
MPARPTPSSARRTAALLGLLLGAGVALAPAAAAVDDLTKPDYRLTSGPNCHPGGVQIEVVAGTGPYAVVLATTRQPDGEDSAELAPGETVLLQTGDVDWGETIDSRLEFTALDGSGETFADDLVPYSFTRPAQEDCAAIAPPGASGPATVPATTDGGVAAEAPAGGLDLQADVAVADVPGVRVTRHGSPWAPALAGISLVGAAGGLVLEGARRHRRGTPTAGA